MRTTETEDVARFILSSPSVPVEGCIDSDMNDQLLCAAAPEIGRPEAVSDRPQAQIQEGSISRNASLASIPCIFRSLVCPSKAAMTHC